MALRRAPTECSHPRTKLLSSFDAGWLLRRVGHCLLFGWGWLGGSACLEDLLSSGGTDAENEGVTGQVMWEMAQGCEHLRPTRGREEGCSGRVEWKGGCWGQGQQEQGKGPEPTGRVPGATRLEAAPGYMNPTPADGSFLSGRRGLAACLLSLYYSYFTFSLSRRF